MPICIECRYPVSTLYTTYSKADDKALGKGVRLTQCPHCKRFADKYVEHDFVVLFIDLVLIKPQVCRTCACVLNSDFHRCGVLRESTCNCRILRHDQRRTKLNILRSTDISYSTDSDEKMSAFT